MSTISSNQEKRHALIDPIYVLVFLVLVLALLVFGPFAANIASSTSGVLEASGGEPASLSTGASYSMAADQQYWDASCTRGWSTGSACEAIAQRVQSCAISTASTYCSEYALHLQQFRNQ